MPLHAGHIGQCSSCRETHWSIRGFARPILPTPNSAGASEVVDKPYKANGKRVVTKQVQHGAVEPQGIHLSRRGAWAVWRNASARHRLCQLQPTATNCNELHILRSAQKPLSFTTPQNAVTARTVGENSSRFYARRGNPSVAPKIGRPNKVWPPRHVLQLFSTP